MKNNNTSDTIQQTQMPMLFQKKNYIYMALGFLIIAIGFFLMMGPDANTMPDGKFNPDYFNYEIFSFTRIRLAPIIILIGFGIEIFAILKKFPQNN